MKVTQIFIVLALSFVVNANFISNAQAFDLGSSKDKIAKKIEEAKIALEKEIERQAQIKKEADKKEEEKRIAAEAARNPKVNNSRFESTQVFPIDTRWALIKVSKDQYLEDIILPVSEGRLSKAIILRDGEGQYLLKIYATNNPKKYGGSYTYISEVNLINLDIRDLSFLQPSENVQSDDPAIKSIAEKLVGQLDDDADKVKRIHDYVARALTYDWDGYRDGSYVNKATDATAVLKGGVTVCAGYSNLFAAIARAANIRTSVIHGKAIIETGTGDHAWNEVLINDEWKIVDVTWDDMDTLRYDYFFPNPEVFSRDHQKLEVKTDF